MGWGSMGVMAIFLGKGSFRSPMDLRLIECSNGGWRLVIPMACVARKHCFMLRPASQQVRERFLREPLRRIRVSRQTYHWEAA